MSLKNHLVGLAYLICCINKLNGQIVACKPQKVDDRKIRIVDTTDIKKVRAQLLKAIWKNGEIPDRSNVILSPNTINPLKSSAYIKKVDKLEIPVQENHEVYSDSIKDLAYLFEPEQRSNRLIIINPGHSCTLKETRDSFRVEATIIGLLKEGFDVLAVYMPHVSENGCNLDHCSIMNTASDDNNKSPTYGLRYFLEPTIVSLNYLLSKHNYDDVNMIGLSGGGWTTNIIAAIDNRIKYSFSIAGSMPLYNRPAGSLGDIEQFIPELYRDVAGYLDIYILGAFGKGRKQIQILNRYDNCCFGEMQHNPKRNYKKDILYWQRIVSNRLAYLGAKNHYSLIIDTFAPNHQISEYALTQIILPALKKQMSTRKYPLSHSETLTLLSKNLFHLDSTVCFIKANKYAECSLSW